jgi:Ser/Thr protein kinase RdoA (MazF antagonist)
MGRGDVYSQPDAPDPVLPAATVLDLARRHLPSAAEVTGVDESGGEARAYLVDGGAVLKTQRPHRLRPRTSLAKEAYLLDTFGPQLGAAIPRLLGYDRVDTADGPVEYVLMTRMPGVAAAGLDIPPAARPVLLADLGRLLATLHTIAADDPVVPRDPDAAAVRRRLEFAFADIADALVERPGAWRLPVSLDQVAARVLDAVPPTLSAPPVTLHSNPGPVHVFVDPVTYAMTGVIDLGDAYASQPAFDLNRWASPADRIAIRDGYLGGEPAEPGFTLMWTIAMAYTDSAAVAGGSVHADRAATDLMTRLDEL